MSKLDKIGSNPMLPTGQITAKPTNVILLEPLTDKVSNQSKQITIKNSLKISKIQSQNEYQEIKSIESNQEIIADRKQAISVRRQTVNEFGSDEKKLDLKKETKA